MAIALPNPRFTEPLGVLTKSCSQISWEFARAICQIPGDCLPSLADILVRLLWGTFGQVMQIVWRISASSSGSSFGNLRNPWEILTKSSGNFLQVPGEVLVGICEFLRRSGTSPGGIPGRQPREILRGRHANRLRVLGIFVGSS